MERSRASAVHIVTSISNENANRSETGQTGFKNFANAIRTHWNTENRLHWTLDVVKHDDLVRLRTGHGPENMAVIRHCAMNLVSSADDKHSLKARRKKANLDTDYLAKLLTRPDPLTRSDPPASMRERG